MRTMTKTIACPVCGQPATITLYENVDPIRGSEGHDIRFSCTDSRHELDEPQKLKLWVADRVGS